MIPGMVHSTVVTATCMSAVTPILPGMCVPSTPPTVPAPGVPAMSMNVRDQARRFITLVDELYNARTLLVASAACPPDALFSAASGSEEPIIDLESLQFETAVEGGAPACWPVCGCGGSG